MSRYHRELGINTDRRGLAVFSFENPAVSYCLMDTNQKIDRWWRSGRKDASDSPFYNLLSEVELWEHVSQVPEGPDMEYYHVKLSILGRVCVCDVELWRSPYKINKGYIRVLSIDDTD